MDVQLECEISIGLDEISSIFLAAERVVVSLGLKPPKIYLVRVFCRREPKDMIKVDEGVYVDLGVIAVRGGVLPNVMYDELIKGYIALALIETYKSLDKELVEKISGKYYLSIVRDALWGVK